MTDSFDRQRLDRELPVGAGVPDFEAAILLAVSFQRGWLSKGTLALLAMRMLSAREQDKPKFLRWIDALQGLTYLHKHDFQYELTPAGARRLKELYRNMSLALWGLQETQK